MGWSPGFVIAAGLGVILSAVYMLWMFQRVVWGEVTNDANARLKDLSIREWAIVAPLLILMIWIGDYSQPFMFRTEVSSKHLIHTVQAKQLRDDGQAFANTDLVIPRAELHAK